MALLGVASAVAGVKRVALCTWVRVRVRVRVRARARARVRVAV